MDDRPEGFRKSHLDIRYIVDEGFISITVKGHTNSILCAFVSGWMLGVVRGLRELADQYRGQISISGTITPAGEKHQELDGQ